MNRRRFIQSVAAMLAMPGNAALSLSPATAAIPAAVAVPNNARFWAVYMSALHGECTPQTLQNLLHIPEMDAKRYVSQLISDGVIKPNPMLQKSVSKIFRGEGDSVFDTASEGAELNKQVDQKALDIGDQSVMSEDSENEFAMSEDSIDTDTDTEVEIDEPVILANEEDDSESEQQSENPSLSNS